MIKMIAAVGRRPGMTHADYIAYIYRVHAKIAREVPGTLSRYIQNHVFDSAFGVKGENKFPGPEVRDSVTELFFESMEAMQANFMDPHVQQKVGPDGINFSDLTSPISLIARDVEQSVADTNIEQVAAAANAANAKVLHFLRAAPELSLEEFERRLTSAHETVLKENPVAASTVRRCVHNIQLAEANEILKYFGQQPLPVFEAMASLWFDNESCIASYRSYEQTLLKINSDPERRFYEPDQSFFLYAQEKLIIGEF